MPSESGEKATTRLTFCGFLIMTASRREKKNEERPRILCKSGRQNKNLSKADFE
jgi:hypothetical protein